MKNKDLKKIALVFLLFRVLTLIWGKWGMSALPLKEMFLGGGTQTYLENPLLWGWANFDGVHYLSIADHGYFQYEQAFFPLFPLVIRLISQFSKLSLLVSGLAISHLAFFFSLIIFSDLVSNKDPSPPLWPVILLITFPTSFFFLAVYNESLFLLLVLLTFWLSKKDHWFLASLTAALASATRLVGILLIPALVWDLYQKKKGARSIFALTLISSLGLLSYMVYLGKTTGDPLCFFHVQPQFGAGRSGSNFILLPQVFYRYLKIFLTVSMSTPVLWVAVLELATTLFVFWLLYLVRKQVPFSWLIFSFSAVIVPTLTGTLSSMPRYILPAIALSLTAKLPSSLRWLWVVFFLPLQALLTALFLRGYFIS
jgi:hypothetical protein